jgi:hypothetical protein
MTQGIQQAFRLIGIYLAFGQQVQHAFSVFIHLRDSWSRLARRSSPACGLVKMDIGLLRVSERADSVEPCIDVGPVICGELRAMPRAQQFQIHRADV